MAFIRVLLAEDWNELMKVLQVSIQCQWEEGKMDMYADT